MDYAKFKNQYVVGDDYARNNLYEVQVGLPPGLGAFYNNAQSISTDRLSYMIKQVTVPGKSLGTIDARRFGPVFKVANDMIVDTVAMTVMLSTDYREHALFEGWISAVTGVVKAQDKRQKYTLSYYEQYVSWVDIIPVLRVGESAPVKISLEEAYPTNVGPIELSWGSDGQVAEFNVTWSFRDWHYTGAEPKEILGYSEPHLKNAPA